MGTERLVNLLRYVAANVVRLRQQKGMTQQRLAEAADIDLRHLQRIERANVNLSVAALLSLADALDVEPGALFLPADLPPPKPGRPPMRPRRVRRGSNGRA